MNLKRQSSWQLAILHKYWRFKTKAPRAIIKQSAGLINEVTIAKKSLEEDQQNLKQGRIFRRIKDYKNLANQLTSWQLVGRALWN